MQRRSAQTRNLDATINKRQQLSEIISRPAQNRWKQPAPPTTGKHGRALASQQVSLCFILIIGFLICLIYLAQQE